MINLTSVAKDGEWHLETVIGNLIGRGLCRADAEAFANFIFTEAASEGDSSETITDLQWEMLAVKDGEWFIDN